MSENDKQEVPDLIWEAIVRNMIAHCTGSRITGFKVDYKKQEVEVLLDPELPESITVKIKV